ncbi:MAG: polyprenyl synthetase family protein [Candidatus Neomarinimicrobiota bacterium]
MIDLSQLIDFIRKEFNHSLKSFPLPESPKYLYNPIKYSLESKGKRYRPIIVHLVGRSFKSDPDELMKISLGIELLHNFTLIHDDIMDSDETRRNIPTLHKKFDVPSAILAGDGIFTISQLILISLEQCSTKLLQKYNEVVLEICEGQALDKEFEDQGDIELDAYIDMVKKKTGALLGACLCLPAIMQGESSEKVEKLYDVGKCLGVAFQLQDDFIEIFGDEKVIGKSLGSDISANKKTAIALIAKKINSNGWNNLVSEFDGNNLEKIRNFLLDNGIHSEIEDLTGTYFQLSYESLLKLGFNQDSEVYRFFKIIQGRHS